MTRVFIDGLENGDPYLKLWDATNLYTTGARISSEGLDMDGQYCFNIIGGAFWAQKNLPAANEYYFSFWIRPYSTNSERIIKFLSGTTILASLYRTNDSNGYFKAYRGDGDTLLATSGAVLSVNTTYKVQVYIKIDDSAGRFKVVQDGITVIDYTGDTKPSTETTIDSFIIGAVSGEPNFYMDNIIVDDAVMPPTVSYIRGLQVTGSGNSTGWTASAGDNYDCVDEIPYSDTDYISTNTANAIDLYSIEDLSGAIGQINCVQVQVRAKYDGSPTPTQISPMLRTGGVDYIGDAFATTINYKSIAQIWEQNPNTIADWTETDVNGLEIGVKAIS